MSGTYSNASCIEEGYKKKFHYTSNSWGILYEFNFSLNNNPNGGYVGPSVLLIIFSQIF
jgi:hypothetical protein